MKLSELVPGDQILVWMRLGLALKVGRKADSSLYRYVPSKPSRTQTSDLTRFVGWIAVNNPQLSLITLQVSKASSRNSVGFHNEPALPCDIHYTAFQRVRKFSAFHYEPSSVNHTFPANFPDAKFKPYRTLIEVELW